MVPSQAQDRAEVFDVLNRYPEAADRRDWPLYDLVFTPDATAEYGMSKLTSRQAIVNLIRKSLGGCGPTQHLLGNQTAEVDGDEARASWCARSTVAPETRPRRDHRLRRGRGRLGGPKFGF
jgi:hypothetical protein